MTDTVPATFADADAPGWYSPRTDMGKRYRQMCYWFAAGHEHAQRELHKASNGTPLPGYWDIVDHSDRFGRYAAYMADRYELGIDCALGSVISLFDDYRKEHA
jgi:hypothetical protein